MIEYEAFTREIAALTVLAINQLAIGGPCCPHGCAPCTGLLSLYNAGILSEVIGPYVYGDGGTNWDWWDEDANELRWSWVTKRWCDPETCEVLQFDNMYHTIMDDHEFELYPIDDDDVTPAKDCD